MVAHRTAQVSGYVDAAALMAVETAAVISITDLTVRSSWNFHLGVMFLMLVALAGCGSRASSPIADQFSASGHKGVDLAEAVPDNWDRVCVLGPYSSDAVAAQTLGFTWPAETLTDIERDDGISLLVFVQGKTVISYVEHPRSSGDFSNLTGRCFSHDSARFVQAAQPANGWPGLFPADEA